MTEETKMKMACISCNTIYEPTPADIMCVSGMIDRNNLKSDAYLHKLADQAGACKDDNIHLFEFDQKFDIDVHSTINNIIAIEKNIQDTTKTHIITSANILELEKQLKNLVKQSKQELDTIEQKGEEKDKELDKLQRLTFSRNIKPWTD